MTQVRPKWTFIGLLLAMYVYLYLLWEAGYYSAGTGYVLAVVGTICSFALKRHFRAPRNEPRSAPAED